MGTTALLVMAGGALGALLRFILDRTLLSVQHDSTAKGRRAPAFSTGILLANLFGSFLLGLFTVALSLGVMSDSGYAIWGVGLCGSLTTFSTFSVEVVTMLRTHHGWQALFYVLGSILGGLALGVLAALLILG